MIIEGNTKITTFGELKIGDVFRFSGDIYIKIPYYTTDTGYDFDAYNLSNNDVYNFNNYEDVEKIKAKLVIE
jgi:hypothetical protein